MSQDDQNRVGMTAGQAGHMGWSRILPGEAPRGAMADIAWAAPPIFRVSVS